MDARTLSKLALRVLSVYILAQGFMILPGLLDVAVMGTPQGGIPYGTLWLVLAMLMPFAVGLLIWGISPWVADLAVGSRESGTSVSPLAAETLQVIAFVTIGSGILIIELPRAAGILYEAAFYKDAGYVLLRGEDFFVAIATIILSMALILGGKYFTTLIRRLRDLGS
jgi:hypothetical protein